MSELLKDDLEWSAISDLEAGEFFTLGETCPLTFVSLGGHLTNRGSVEVKASCLAGIRDGGAFVKVFYRPSLEVLIVPDERVGERVGAAVEAFRDRAFKGNDHIELPPEVWPSAPQSANAAEVTEVPC